MIMIDTIENNLGAEAIGLYAKFTLPFAEILEHDMPDIVSKY